MERLEKNFAVLGHILRNKKNRHIAGGLLISMSIFFGGLAITVMTINTNEMEEENNYE
ncbi:histidine kinase [Firmicutes bacterium AM31-12AC]|nr:histidine kinase [Firmicutes bacterium AM31-12AC]